MDKHVSQTYLTQQIMTASPAKLVAMLYDRAISLLGEAIAAIEAGDVERRWKATGKATEVISHLWETLDMEQGGEVAANLSQLYGYIFRVLPKIDLDNDPKAAREVIGLELFGYVREAATDFGPAFMGQATYQCRQESRALAADLEDYHLAVALRESRGPIGAADLVR